MELPREGILEKQGGGTSIFGSRGWRERYFVIKDGKLGYWKDKAAYESGRPPCKNRFFPVSSYKLVPEPGSHPGEFLFVLQLGDGKDGPRKELRIRAASDRVRSRWLRSIVDHGASDPARLAPPKEKDEKEEATEEEAVAAGEEENGDGEEEEEKVEEEGGGEEEKEVEEEEQSSAPPPPEPEVESAAPPPPEPEVESAAPPPPEPEVESAAPPPPEPEVESAAPPPPEPEVESAAPPPPEPEEKEGLKVDTEGDGEEEDGSVAWVEPTPAAEAPDAVISDPAECPEDEGAFRVCNEANLTALFDWIDLNSDGSIQVIEFTNAASGRSWKEISKALGVVIDDSDRAHKISGAILRVSDFRKMALFQKVDRDGNTLISREEFVDFFTGNEEPHFCDWMQDILCQLNDLKNGRYPKRRGFRTTFSSEEEEGKTPRGSRKTSDAGFSAAKDGDGAGESASEPPPPPAPASESNDEAKSQTGEEGEGEADGETEAETDAPPPPPAPTDGDDGENDGGAPPPPPPPPQ